MSIRYERQGLRVVRTGVDGADGAPAPQDAHAVAARVEDDLAQAHALVRTAAANLRKLARLRRTQLVPKADRDGRRQRAAELGVTPAGIRLAREQTGLSQRDLGRALSYSRGLVAEVEHGRRSPPPRLSEWAAAVLGTSSTMGTKEGPP